MTASKKPVFATSRPAYQRALKRAVRDALNEDMGSGDITSEALGLRGKHGRAVLVAKENGVLAGADAFTECFRALDRHINVRWAFEDGNPIRTGKVVATITGDAAAILSGERSAINFIAHLSGIASLTSKMVALIPMGTARLLDTRKTTPGLRLLEKHATALGGACNHRLGLYDAFMIKDNHVAAVGSMETAISMASRKRGRRQLICETADMDQVRTALNHGARWLLLDNFKLPVLRAAVKYIRRWEEKNDQQITIEASGGVTPKNIAAISHAGVDYISSGYITHSAASIDFSLEWAGSPAMPRHGVV